MTASRKTGANMEKNELLEQAFTLKESNECVFWIRLLTALGDLNRPTSERLSSELASIRNMLGPSILTAKSNVSVDAGIKPN